MGLPLLKEEFAQRPWLLTTSAQWDQEHSRVVVTVETEVHESCTMDQVKGSVHDEVWDCVIATCPMSGDIRFDVEESIVVQPT